MADQPLDPAAYIRQLPGLVATVCTTGAIMPEFSDHRSHLRSHNDRNGLHNIEYRTFDAKLVEKGRDDVCEHALHHNYAWILMIDADAAPFPADALERFLTIAFVERPETDVLGAYCQLKQRPFLPTIDTGTGKWEQIPPQSGLKRVIRTGGHFVLLKTSVLGRFGPPWFRSRRTIRPLAALKEIDTFARVTLDGKNPLTETGTWRTLVQSATGPGHHQKENTVGEDSGFSDRVTSTGGTIYVDTDTVVGHVGKKTVMPDDLREEIMRSIEHRFERVGVRGYQ